MDNHSNPLDSVFSALSDATRRAVINRLALGPASVTALAEPFDMALPSFMKHVSMLEKAGLIRSIKVGRIRTCTLEPHALAMAEQWFNEQREIWASRYQNLDDLLTTLQGDHRGT